MGEYITETNGRAALLEAAHDAEALASHPGPVWRVQRGRMLTRAVPLNATAKGRSHLPLGMLEKGILLEAQIPAWQRVQEEIADEQAAREQLQREVAAAARARAEWLSADECDNVRRAATAARELARTLRAENDGAARLLASGDGDAGKIVALIAEQRRRARDLEDAAEFLEGLASDQRIGRRGR
jgi:hypothetical protein